MNKQQKAVPRFLNKGEKIPKLRLYPQMGCKTTKVSVHWNGYHTIHAWYKTWYQNRGQTLKSWKGNEKEKKIMDKREIKE